MSTSAPPTAPARGGASVTVQPSAVPSQRSYARNVMSVRIASALVPAGGESTTENVDALDDAFETALATDAR